MSNGLTPLMMAAKGAGVCYSFVECQFIFALFFV
jgi:hypothetical protein